MIKIGLDISLRSTGVVVLEDDKIKTFQIFDPEPSIKEEELLIKNAKDISEFIHMVSENSTGKIGIEGFSFGAISGSKDMLFANTWMVRCALKQLGILDRFKLSIIPVTSWRSPLFNKEERKSLKDAKDILKKNKVSLRGLKGQDRLNAMETNRHLESNASIKVQTMKKLPLTIQSLFLNYIIETGRKEDQVFDLCDAYNIAKYLKG